MNNKTTLQKFPVNAADAVEQYKRDPKTYLVVVDMQNDFLTGSLANNDAQNVIANVSARLAEARENNENVIWTYDTHSDDYMTTQEGQKLPVPHCIDGTDGWQVCDELEYVSGDIRYRKPTFGCIELAQDLADSIANNKIYQSDVEITLVGVCTDICVISNAMLLKAALPEARIVVDASCCAGVTPESHETALAAMKACQIEIVNGEKEMFAKDVRLDSDFPEALDGNGEGFAHGMASCPNCHTNKNLHVRSDLASLNALEYWIDCDGCGEHWTDRMMGRDYVETPEQLVGLWNEKMLRLDKPEMTD